MAIVSSPSYAVSNTILLWQFQDYSFSGIVTCTFMEPESAVKTLHPVIHFTASSPHHQTQTPASLHLSPARICTAVRTDGGSPGSARQKEPKVVAAPPKRRSVSQPSPGNICNSVLPLGSLTRPLLMPQGLNTDYSSHG